MSTNRYSKLLIIGGPYSGELVNHEDIVDNKYYKDNEEYTVLSIGGEKCALKHPTLPDNLYDIMSTLLKAYRENCQNKRNQTKTRDGISFK